MLCPSHTAGQWQNQKGPDRHRRARSSSAWGNLTDAAWGSPTSSQASSSLTSTWGDNCRETRHRSAPPVSHTPTPQLGLAGQGKKTPVRQAGSERSSGCPCPAAIQKGTTQCSTITAVQGGFGNTHQEHSLQFISQRLGGTTKSPLHLLRAETTTFHPILALLNPGTHAWLKPVLWKGILS